MALPITLISFACFTKWWYALPEDAPETMYIGFPLPFAGPGWHTSMSFQIFMVEFIFDFLVYFFIVFTLLLILELFSRIKPHRVITGGLWAVSFLILAYWAFIVFDSNNIFYTKRPYKMTIEKTGYKFVFQDDINCSAVSVN